MARRHAPRPGRRGRPARRIGAVTAALLLGFTLVGVRVTQLQALSGERYQALALDQRLRTIEVTARRGSIFDRNGRDLALSIERSSVFADPRFVTDPAMYASRLAPLLGVDQSTLLERLADRDRRFVFLARTVDDTVVEEVRAMGLQGVGFVPEPKRHYPAGSLAAAVVGQVGTENVGLDGLELLYDDLLAGVPGEVVVERDQHGREIPDTERSRVEAQPGTDLVLTLDQALQFRVEQSLVDQVAATDAVGGMAVVVDVTTGDILAMATVVGGGGSALADAADPDAEHASARVARAGERNRPLVDLFEPGSTNKVITVAAAIEHGEVGPHTPFDVPAHLRVGDATFRDVHAHGVEQWSTTDILRESSNVGSIMIAQHLGAERLDAALRAFGFGHRTTVEFPGQPRGLLLDPSQYYSTGLASVAIGYSVAVTALQMVNVYATIANGGETRPPRLVDATIDATGQRHPVGAPATERVISRATAETLVPMLAAVVRDGTGSCAAVRGYTVAGKTGTSRKPAPTGGYSDRTMASFAGFAPAESPRFAAIVVVDEPDSEYGSRAAAPVFAEIMQFALQQHRVPPTDLHREQQFDVARRRAAAEGNDCQVPHGPALEEHLAQKRAQASAAAAPAATSTTGTLPTDTTQQE